MSICPHFTILMIHLCASLTCAQMHWEKLFDNLSYKPSDKPAPRRDAAIGFDINRDRVIVFGGWQTSSPKSTNFQMPILFDDTWEYDLKTKTWRALSFSLTRPPARYGMLYSHNRQGLYVCCGRGLFENYFNDLWVYDFNDDQWREMDQTYISITPEPRYSPVGGIYPSYESSLNQTKSHLYLGMGSAQYEMFDNMYFYQFTDLRSLKGLWDRVYTEILTGAFSFTHPHGRIYSSSAMISTEDLLIFGGCLSGSFSGGPCPSSDSWLFSAEHKKWQKVDSSCITPRKHASMASIVSDGYRKSAVLFSGLEYDRTIVKTVPELDDEIALYDNLANRWSIKKVQGSFFPEKRNGHVMCSGKLRSDFGVFMYGGFGHSRDSTLGDLWFLKINISTAFENTISMNYLSKQNKIKPKCSSYFSTIHLHAILMFVGWAVMINISNILSKYLKSRKCTNLFSNCLLMMGILLVTGGIIFGFWSSHGLPHLAHLIIGLAAYLLILIQPVIELMKQQTKKIEYYIDENEKNKAMRYKSGLCYNLVRFLNKSIQTTAISLATVNISLGVFYAVFDWYWILTWFTFLGANFFLYIVLEIWKSNKKQAQIKKEASDDESDSEKEFSLSKADSTQQLKPAQNKEAIKMQPFRYTNSNPRSLQAKYQDTSIENSTVSSKIEKIRNGHLSYSPKINVSYIGDNEYDHEVNYVIAKKAALKEKIESLTSSPISSIGILNQNSLHK